MHAFLLIGESPQIEAKTAEIVAEKGSKIVNFELKKIEDVRNLNNQTRLKITENISYLIPNINEASEEALNAFLKNLEEPQEGLSYILTTQNISSVLPTIVSRCKVVRLVGTIQDNNDKDVVNFDQLSEGKRMDFVDKIKDRGEAIQFVEKYINFNHQKLIENKNIETLAKNLKIALKTLKHLKANGNVTLQLANFVASLV